MTATKTAKKTKPKTMLVRIHRPNKRLGYNTETFTLSGSGYPKFDYRRGWYEVDLATATKLRRALNNPLDRASKPVFEVVTREEAKAIEVAERQVVAEATAPVPLPKRVHTPTREEVKAVPKPDPVDEDLDLSNDVAEEAWEDLSPVDDEEVEAQETASADDLEDLDDLVEAPKPVAKKTAKKKTAKKKPVKKTAKKTAKKTRGS